MAPKALVAILRIASSGARRMSMNLYLKAGAHGDLMQLMRDEGSLTALLMPRMMGRLQAAGAFRDHAEIDAAFADLEMSAQSLDQQMQEMSKAAWSEGVFSGLGFQLMKGHIRSELAAMSGQMGAAKAQLRATLSGVASADAEADDICDLHKSWHVLHYLFTGSAWGGPPPGNMLLRGGKAVGEDLGYGRPRVADASAVQAFARFLHPLSADGLKARIDIKQMAKLQIYCAEEEDAARVYELHDDVEHYFPQLKAYVANAAARRQSLAIWMT